MDKNIVSTQVQELEHSKIDKFSVDDKLKLRKAEMEEREYVAKQKNLDGALKFSNYLAIAIFILVFIYIIFICGTIYWEGSMLQVLRLNDKVLITLLTTTTVNILGLLYLVIKYVFHHRLKI